MKKYYAANNAYASPISVGGANTWYALAFISKKARDEYVDNANSLAARAIKRSEVTRYAGGFCRDPKPFSGEFWCICEHSLQGEPEGCIGEVVNSRYSPAQDYAIRLNP
jgi:hypothetical protein